MVNQAGEKDKQKSLKRNYLKTKQNRNTSNINVLNNYRMNILIDNYSMYRNIWFPILPSKKPLFFTKEAFCHAVNKFFH